ncbi:MAG: GntR family transcriptional regulator [Paracoccaceae bacterium]|nr:GntR family transcriptional regulator [Paracoccaceae bacterium]
MAVEQDLCGNAARPVRTDPPGARTQRRAWLARRILEELILRDAPAGTHVTEVAMAESLGVSRSPVRASLDLLAEHGVLSHIRNRGFFLRENIAAYDGLAVSGGTSPEDQLYADILEARLNEKLVGRVTQIELARRFEAPESRVGAVLTRMREEGLVRRNPGRGWHFQPAINTTEALAQSYALRLAVEPAALRQPGIQIDPNALDLSRRRHEALLARAGRGPMIQAQVFEVDSGFHEMLVRFSGNPYFLEAVQTQNRLRTIVEFVDYSDLARIKLWCVEHLRILDALAVGDAELAAKRVTAHLQRASKSIGRQTTR